MYLWINYWLDNYPTNIKVEYAETNLKQLLKVLGCKLLLDYLSFWFCVQFRQKEINQLQHTLNPITNTETKSWISILKCFTTTEKKKEKSYSFILLSYTTNLKTEFVWHFVEVDWLPRGNKGCVLKGEK